MFGWRSLADSGCDDFVEVSDRHWFGGHSPRSSDMPFGSVVGRPVEHDDQTDDLVVADAEVVRQDDLVGKVRLIELAVIGTAHDRVAIVVNDLAYIDADLVPDQLFAHPPPDRVRPDELTVVVVDVGIPGES